MAGTLGRLAEMAPEDIERIHAGLTTSANDAIKQLMARGIDTPGPPESYRGEMPPNLTSMSDNEIGDLLNKLSSWCGFLDVELAKAASRKRESEDHLYSTKARIRIGFKVDEENRKLAGPDKDDRVACDPRVVEATRQDIFHYTYYMLLKGVRDEAQKNWETVSRRITQRGQEVSRLRRDGNVDNTPVAGRAFTRRQRS
jgi:hypothetical protein